MTASRIHSCTWHEMHRLAQGLALRLPVPRMPWLGIVAISRGGLIPAAIVARVLDVRMVETACISSYAGKQKGPINIIKAPGPAVGDGQGWLMVDDVADTGATAQAARDMLPAALFATLFAKPAGKPFIDFSLIDVDQDTWIDFPWDRDPAKP